MSHVERRNPPGYHPETPSATLLDTRRGKRGFLLAPLINGIRHGSVPVRPSTGLVSACSRRTRASAISRTIAVLAAIVWSAPLLAAYPEKPITVLVGWGAGGGMDTFTRVVAKYAPKYLGAELVIRHKKGGAGAIAHNELVKAPADGYTIAVANVPHQAIPPQIRQPGQSGYELDDLVWLATFARVPGAVLVRSESPLASLDDLAAAAKQRPGKVTSGVPGARGGSAAFLYQYAAALGVDIKLISYKGGGKTMKALLGGETNTMSSNANWSVRYADKTRTLAHASESRYPLTPDIPTFRELGYDVVDYLTRSFDVRAGVPDEARDHLRDGFAAMSKDPTFAEDMAKIGLVVEFMNGDATQAYVDDYVKSNEPIFDMFRKMVQK